MKDIIKIISEKYISRIIENSIDLTNLKIDIMNVTEEEISKTNDEIQKLKDNLEKILRLYCKKHGHNYITINNKVLQKTWESSFLGDGALYELTRKCTVCGDNDWLETTMFSCPDRDQYKQEIPESIYNDESLTINGKTYQMTNSEISRLEKYIEYLNELKCTLYDLIDNTIEKINEYNNSTCKKAILWNNYINYLKNYPIIYNVEAFLRISSFEDYQNNNHQIFLNNNSSKGYSKKIKYNNHK